MSFVFYGKAGPQIRFGVHSQ